MSRPRFLADHDLNEHIVIGVLRREPAIEFPRVREFGLSEALDAAVLDFAQRHGFLVVSHDVNTMPAAAYARLSSGGSVHGVFMVQQALPIAAAIDNLVLIWAATNFEDWTNQVVFLPLT
jgi:hypothetical protein